MPVLAANYTPKRFTNMNTGEGMYPYSLNNRNPQNTTSNSVKPVGGGTSAMQSIGNRNVVQRRNRARAATNSAPATANNRRVVQRPNSGRSAINTPAPRNTPTSTNRNSTNRAVVARGSNLANNPRTTSIRRNTTTTSDNASVPSSQKCFANYKECMDMYCEREDTMYNRCYCSAKLAQIDSKYKKTIDSKVEEIIRLQNKVVIPEGEEPLDPEDLETYWQQTIGAYTDTNSWKQLDTEIQNVLDKLQWADTETRVRGQSAFNIGHEYCVNYLQSCSYISSNLRNAYKSEIGRDCANYEDTLKKIKTIADATIEKLK